MSPVGYSILIAIWYMISNNIDQHGVGADHFLNRTGPHQAIRQLGYDTVVTVSEAPAQYRFISTQTHGWGNPVEGVTRRT